MKESELIEFLSTFDKKEMNEFEKFILSPFFTQGKGFPSEKLIHFFREIRKYYPNFDSKNFTAENVYSKVYPGSGYKDIVVRNLNSKLLNLARQFVSVQHFLTSEFEFDYSVSAEMFNRKLDKAFEKSVKKTEANLEKRKHDSSYYYDKFRLEDYITAYKGRKSYANSKEMDNMSGDFFRFVILRSLQIYMLLTNQQAIVNYSYKKPLMNEMLQFLKSNIKDYSNTPEVEIYYNLLNLFITDDEKYFFVLKDLKDKHVKSLDTVEQNNLYLCLGNYCLKKIANGNTQFNKERFELDKQYLLSGLIDIKHYLKMPLFLSMSMNAIAIKEYEWLDNFLSQYLKRLPPDYRTFAENYIRAEILYSRDKFNDALIYLAKAIVEVPYYKQLIRNLTLKIYYELDYIDEGFAVVDTSKHFILNDNELPANLREDFNKFIGYTKQLFSVKNHEDSYTLKKALKSCDGFRNKDWILKKLDKFSH